MGMIVAPYRLEQMKSLLQDDTRVATVGNKVYTVADLYTQQAEKLHMSAGAGLHIIMNQNFNIACELGKCFSQSDGTGLGMRIGLSYIF